jgi:branched-chain amino acid transport system substrate-binding protein
VKTRIFVSLLVAMAILATGCTPSATATPAAAPTSAPAAAAGAPDVCAKDAFGCAKIPAGQSIKIGMGSPLTGDNASYGIDISQGGKVAVTDAGDFQGWKFELASEDDGGSAEGGAAVANKFVADPTVVAVAGHIFSGATAAAVPIYEKAGIPMLSPSATNPNLTTTGSKVFNRAVFTDAVQGKFSANYLFTKLHIKNLAVLHDGTDYGKGLAQIVSDTFKSLGGNVVDFEGITTGEKNLTPVLSAVAATKPEAVYFGGYTGDGQTIANQMKETGLDKAIFFGCDGTFGNEFIDKTGKNGEGAFAVTLIPADSPAKLKFDAAYTAAYGKGPGVLSPYTWNGYDAVSALIAMVEKVAVKSDDGNLYIPRGALVDAVRGMTDYKGITGTLTCDKVGECHASDPILMVVKDAKWVPAQ